ncbi:amidase [Clostridium omnivorum]|uniref:Amidase n=2 Tax=Clostridium omnivorum TaxID=1604902 RepID=A0ABQ5N3J6_9CLOT|nr:N-acetylmuramoyl-L-alanine amidase CwlD [Clostridium sp. E14]GLC29777.1 amidase [Clostridium sp. E14]
MRQRKNKCIKFKNYNFKIFIAIVVMAAILFNTAYGNELDREDTKKAAKKIILIDPGHGGRDGGGSSKSGIVEKEVNLEISLKLREKLKEMGCEVIMTRDCDKGLYSDTAKNKKKEDLANRCKLKKDTNCDLFISIHQNMFPESKYYGAQVWYTDNAYSKKLAHMVQENLKMDLSDNNNRIEKPARDDYRILRCEPKRPGILVECGFLSNPQEAEKLAKNEYQQKLADSLARSIKQYFDEYGDDYRNDGDNSTFKVMKKYLLPWERK